MGFRIFARALGQVFANPLIVIRLSWFWVIFFSLPVVVELLLPETAIPLYYFLFLNLPMAYILPGLLLILLVYVVAVAALSIGWHRRILRGRAPGWVYIFGRDAPIFSYCIALIWRWILLFVFYVLVFFLLMPVVTGVVLPRVMQQLETDIPVLFFVGGFAVLTVIQTLSHWLFLRIGLGLPAIAVGKRLSVILSFRLTSPISGALLITALCMVIFPVLASVAFEWVTSMFDDSSGVYVAAVASFLIAWVGFFTLFGVLSVIYQHVGEGKRI